MLGIPTNSMIRRIILCQDRSSLDPDLLIQGAELLVELGDLAGRDVIDPHHVGQPFDPPGRDLVDEGLPDNRDQGLLRSPSLGGEERDVAALMDFRYDQMTVPNRVSTLRALDPEKYVVRCRACFPLAGPALASVAILIISIITHLSVAGKGSGSVMNGNSAFLKGVL
jgi:hypothetical protein